MDCGLAGPRSQKVPQNQNQDQKKRVKNQKKLLVTPLQPAVRYEKEKEAISSWKDAT